MAKLTDPGEFEIVKRVYGFEPPTVRDIDTDPVELYDRIQSRRTTNQAR